MNSSLPMEKACERRRIEHLALRRGQARIGEQARAGHLLAHARGRAHRRVVRADRDLAAQGQLLRSGRGADAAGLIAIGVEDAPDALGRMEAGADLGAAPRCLARRAFADDGDPFRRVRALQWAWHQAQIGELPVLAVMRGHRLRQRRIHDLDRFIVAFARFGDAQPDLRHLLRNAGGGADFQPALSQVIQHADFLDHLPRLMIGEHEPHHAQPDRAGQQRNLGDQQVGARAVGEAEMVLAEEDALVAEGFGARPKIDIPIEVVRRPLRVLGCAGLARRREEFEDPGFDHVVPPRRRRASP